MHRRPCRDEFTAWAAVFFAAVATCTHARAGGAELPQVVRVTETFNGSPFSYRINSSDQRADFTVYHVTYPSPVVTDVAQNNTVPAEYYLPRGIRAGDPKRPAVICLHILDGNFELVRMTCSVLASHGVPAMMFKLPYYGERGFAEGPAALAADPELFVSALSQALKDVRRTVDLLASRPEVDAGRIGITGISLGGITAATAAAAEPRLSRAALILAGGDLQTIIHHARETRELSDLIQSLPPERRSRVEQAIDAVDPLRHAERLRPRAARGRVLMVNATEDEVIPRACSEKLAAALGIRDKIVWLDGLGHYTAMAELPRVLKTTAAFFAQDMPEQVRSAPPPQRRRTAVQILATLVDQAATVLVSEPEAGRCHFVDLEFSVTSEGEPPIEGHLSLVRGTAGKFKLRCTLPDVGEVALGHNSNPWMASGEKIVFEGVGGPAPETKHSLAWADPQCVARLRMLAGAAGGAALAPDILNQFCTVTDDAPGGDARAIRLTLTGGRQGSARVELGDDGETPRTVTFESGGVRGRVVVRGWQINTVAHRAMFDPPGGLPVQEVDRRELYRIFAAALSFAMEKIE